MKKRYASLILALLCSLQLSACHRVRIEDAPDEQAMAVLLAQKYLQALDHGEGELVLELAQTPFWGDGEVIASKAELADKLTRDLRNSDEFELQIDNPRFLPMSLIERDYPGTYTRLKAQNFTEDVHAVILKLRFAPGPPGREGLIFVKRQPEGGWKVVGLGKIE